MAAARRCPDPRSLALSVSRLRGWVSSCRLSPQALRHLHGWLTVMWAIMIPISVFTGLRNSVPYLVALSVYALFGSHFSSWQAARAETNGQADA